MLDETKLNRISLTLVNLIQPNLTWPKPKFT